MSSPTTKRALQELISESVAEDCLKVVVGIAGDDKAPHTVRLSASTYLLDQKFGKARQFIEMEAKVATYQDFLNMCAEKVEKLEVLEVDHVPQLPNPEPRWDLLL